MGKSSLKSTIINLARIFFIFSCLSFVFAEDNPQAAAKQKDLTDLDVANLRDEPSGKNEKLTSLQAQARVYRNEGIKMQRSGNLSEAMSLYLKAVQLDPFYAVAFNDLGVIYEANGLLDQAEEAYLRSTRIDPNYLSPYSNLASLYEAKRDLRNAAYYWKKRAELGDPQDIWTQKARRRLEDLRLVLKDKHADPEEENIIDLNKYTAIKKSILRYDDRALARNYFDKAKVSYKKNDHLTALKYAVDAQLLDPKNKEIDAFIEKLQTRLLSK
jgi:tetratricopeptide (TPR) repeat protein